MKSLTITLDAIEKVKKFVNIISRYDSDFDLVSNRYVVDAKSIMGIFSLDLSKPLTLNAQNDTEYDSIVADLKDFIV